MRTKTEGKSESFAKDFFQRQTILRIRCKTKADLVNKKTIMSHEHLIFKKINKIGRLNISFASKTEKLVNELKLTKKQIQMIIDLSGKIKIPLDIMANKISTIRRLELKIRKTNYFCIDAVHSKFPDSTILCSEQKTEKLRILFQIRPIFEQRQELIKNGFIYSYSDMAWTIKLNQENIIIAKNIIENYL